jgi:hypothetical protein
MCEICEKCLDSYFKKDIDIDKIWVNNNKILNEKYKPTRTIKTIVKKYNEDGKLIETIITEKEEDNNIYFKKSGDNSE